MITLQIDEQACVHCSLCVEACPTRVLDFDEDKGLPTVARAAECFGCLACSQECPSDAIRHEGVQPARDFYRDPYAVQLAERICGTAGPPPADEAGLARGLEDLGVRLESLGAVLKDTLSTGLPAVGALAGRTLATQLPRYQVPGTAAEALGLAREMFDPAWGLDPVLEGDTLRIGVRGCFVREICRARGLELGGELCVLFGHYLMGYLGKVTGLRLRLVRTERGWEGCTYEAKVYG